MTEPSTETLAVRPDSPAGLTVSPEAVARAQDFARAALSERSRRAYRDGWAHFEAWCLAHGAQSLPAAGTTVALYLSDLARPAPGHPAMKPSTVAHRLACIAFAHHAAKLPSPRSDANVQAVIKGIRRILGTAQKQARPLLVPELRAAVGKLPEGTQGTRDRALLLLGFSGGFRRSELVALDVGDLAFGDEGLTVTLRRSKTDQEGAGRKVGVPRGSGATCPVRAVKAWLELAGLDKGPVFRPIDRHGNVKADRLTGHAVWSVVKRAAGSDFSGHSLRAGLATAAAKAHKSAQAIMKQTGHKSLAMVNRYIRDAELFDDNAASGLGL